MNIENTYEKIAELCCLYAGSSKWDELILETEIFAKMASITQWIKFENKKIQASQGLPVSKTFELLNAILSIRDDLIKTTGKRIWGLTFTLFPDGKFEIEYDYNKPADYEESDELISFEEINESLNNLKI